MSRPDGPRSQPSARRDWLVWTVLAVWLAPRRAGRRLAHRGLPSALLVHAIGLLGMIATFVAGAYAVAWLEQRLQGGGIYYDLGRTLAGLLLTTGPARAVGAPPMVALGIALLIGELYYWTLGLVVLGPWMGLDGGRRQMLHRSAIAAGYASLWLIPLAASWSGAGALLMLARQTTGHDLALSLSAAACIAALPAGMLAMALRLAGGLGDALTGPVTPPPADGLCEQCGYNLHATPFDARCPECGLPAARSLSPTRRVNAWEVHQRSFARTLWAVLSNAEAFFRTVPVRRNVRPARAFLLGTSVASGVLFAAVTFAGGLTLTVARDHAIDRSAIAEALMAGMILGGFWAAAVPVLSMLSAGALASGSWRRGDRLGGRGAMKIACYLSAVSLPYAVVLGALGILLRYLRILGMGSPGLDPTFVLIWSLVCVGLLTWYWLLGGRAYAGTEFANQ